MTGLDPLQLFVAGTGHIYRAPLETAFPASITATINDPWTDLGYATPEGARFNFGREVNEIFGWQSYDPLRIVTTQLPKEISVDLMQLNKDTWATAIGGGTFTEPLPGEYQYDPPGENEVDEFAMIIEAEDGDKKYRFCYRRVFNMGGVEFAAVRENPIMLPITVKVLASTGNAKPFLVQTNDPAFQPVGSGS
jgi:hypothetical protein